MKIQRTNNYLELVASKNEDKCYYTMLLLTLGLFISVFITITFITESVAGEISCRYYSDHNQQEDLGVMSDIVGGVADLFSGGVATTISGGATAVGVVSQLNDHKIYCTFSIKDEPQENSNKVFYNLIKDGDIIPVFLYENMLQKKIDPCKIGDINTPFSSADQRDKTAKDNEFVFSSKTAVSDIKYFGFIQPKTNNIIMYLMNPKTLELREPNYKQWKEIYENYLK